MRVFVLVLAAAGVLLTRAPSALAQSGAQQATAGPPTAVLVSGPQVGRRAPDFTLPWANRDGVGPVESPYQLWGDLGRTVVLAFYPRSFTPSSTEQMRRFAAQYDQLFGPEVVVLGISSDPVETQSRFAASLGLPFRLLSDPQQQVAGKYGVKDSRGFPRRSVYVIGADGRVRYRNTRFDARDPQDYTELGAAVRAARGG